MSFSHVTFPEADFSEDDAFPFSPSPFMKSPGITPVQALFSLLTAILLGLPSLQAAPGDLDSPKVAIGGGTVMTAVPQPDGKILIGGSFTTVQGKPRNRIARLKANGALDTSFNPNADGIVESIVVQGDGKIVIGGFFTTLQPGAKGPVIPRRHIARLEAKGTVDASFDPNPDRGVLAMALQSDGKIVIGGRFSTLQPNGAVVPSVRGRIARLLPDGSLEAGFSPDVAGDIFTLALQPDGKVLVGGNFSRIGSRIGGGNARLNANGTVDTGFTSGLPETTNSIAVQPDGKILIGGFSFGIVRLNSSGTRDSTFQPNANDPVYSMALQADGKILIAGSFTQLQPQGTPSPVTRNRIARLLPDGAVDAGFNPNANGDVGCVALQADGRILIGGSFTALGTAGTARAGFARLLNDPATQGLTVPTTNQVAWTRGGSSPELGEVTFELSTTKGKTWTPLNAGQRVGSSPHWQVTGVTLPAAGRIRARGVTGDGNGSHGGLIESVLNYKRLVARPEIAVFTGSGTVPANERLSDAGVVLLGSTAQTFTIQNTGVADLTGLAITLAGANPGDFSLGTTAAATLAPGETTTFIVAIAPTVVGVRNAEVNIASNDGDEGVFKIKVGNLTPEIAVSGNGVNIGNGDAAPSTADGTHFGAVTVAGSSSARTFTIANSGSGDLFLGPVTLGGANPADFVLGTQPLSPIPAGRSRTFTIRFAPVDGGTRQATVSFTSNDEDETLFSFDVSGNGKFSSIAHLSALSLNTGLHGFSPFTNSYSANVAHGDGNLVITPTHPEGNARISIRFNDGSYTDINSGSPSAPLPLDVGMNTVEVRVVAQDGTTTRTYTISLMRAAESPGDVDPLDADVEGGPVTAMAAQPDGKWIIAGGFYAVMGEWRLHIARLNADGTLDTGFDPMADGPISTVVIQEDGKVLIGGSFSSLQPNGAVLPVTRNRIARLNADGTLDSAFDPNADADVSCIVLQPDGKIVIGGSFGALRPNGALETTARSRIARLNADGSVDTGFDPNANNEVGSIALQPDGKILIGGGFSTLQPNGAEAATPRSYVARLNADGTLDSGFDPKANNYVSSLAVQGDGKILIGGDFIRFQPNGAVAPTIRSRLARLNSDGTLDAGFNPSVSGRVSCLSLQADGQFLLGGSFASIRSSGGASDFPRWRIARMNAAGVLDFGFSPGAAGNVRCVSVQEDGAVLIGGEFSALQPNGAVTTTPRAHFARILNHPASQSLTAPEADRILWTRGGSSPDVSQVSFELSTDGGGSYTPLGNATRVGDTADWQLTGLSLPATGQIRARGRTTGGNSSGMVETVATFSSLAGSTGSASPLESWRQTHFGSPANSGNGADDFDFDHDGLVNLVEYAFGLDPMENSAGQLPQPRIMGSNFGYEFTPPVGSAGVIHGAEWSDDLIVWQPISDTGSGGQRVFSIPRSGETKLFLRLTVTTP
jgi:uncharacterized delta-60 repeat protein